MRDSESMKGRKRSTIVPRAVFGLAVVGVVPVCVTMASCGGGQQELRGVAAPAFSALPRRTEPDSGALLDPGVAAPAFSGPAHDYRLLGVAATAFVPHSEPSSVALVPDASRDAKKKD